MHKQSQNCLGLWNWENPKKPKKKQPHKKTRNKAKHKSLHKCLIRQIHLVYFVHSPNLSSFYPFKDYISTFSWKLNHLRKNKTDIDLFGLKTDGSSGAVTNTKGTLVKEDLQNKE